MKDVSETIKELQDLIASQYSNEAVLMLKEKITKGNYRFGDTSFEADILSNAVFPNQSTRIEASSSVHHESLEGSMHRINDWNQFIFHTYDNDPSVIIDFAEYTIDDTIFLYNRCQGKEISERIVGARFSVSIDKADWQVLPVELDEDHIYNHKGIPICFPHRFRFLKIDRPNGSDTPLHLSQIIIGGGLEVMNRLAEFVTLVFAHKFDLPVDAPGRIIEDDLNSWYICCKWNSFHEADLSLTITSTGRFSNFLLQITNAIHFAAKVGLHTIYIPDDVNSRNLFPAGGTVISSDHDISIKIGESARGLTLQGMFFFTNKLVSIYNDLPKLRQLVDSIRHATGLNSISSLKSAKELVVHIRSGDIFDGSDVHPAYGQPPFAFYKLAILNHNPDKVVLVYEDDKNPVIDVLKDFLYAQSIDYDFQSSPRLRDDIATIINAEALVIGFGTFAYGVLCFNDVIEKIYTFEQQASKDVLPVRSEKPIESFRYYDVTGGYVSEIMNANWKNTLEQRDLMIRYPSELLTFEKVVF